MMNSGLNSGSGLMKITVLSGSDSGFGMDPRKNHTKTTNKKSDFPGTFLKPIFYDSNNGSDSNSSS